MVRPGTAGARMATVKSRLAPHLFSGARDMSLTDRLNRVQQERATGSLSAPTEFSWEAKQTSPFTRATGSLSLGGEHEIETLARELALTKPELAAAIGLSAAMV